MKPREFWIAKHNQMYADEEIADSIHVREIVPGSITITREDFRAAVFRCESRYVSGLDVELEIELFGETK